MPHQNIMCRIAGIITNNFNEAKIKGRVTAMCNAMQHGGPDDAGFFADQPNGIAFGHRRLSIIDLSKNGHQPMAARGEKAWITFNGEIYNYRELRQQLQKLGAGFATETDTEVILQAYLYWGTAAFNKLRGMFAFALHDTTTQDVYLVRDSSAIKPLYYSTENGELVFASEIKAFKATGIANQADERWPIWLLAYGHIPEPYTTLKNVHSLPKGHYLHWQKNKAYNIIKYTETHLGESITDMALVQTGIRDGLQAAVNRQLVSDAPIGVFLSGGIDSSVISLLANANKEHELKTISIFFDEKEYDERQYQNAVLQKIDGENFNHLVTEKDFEESFPQVLKAMDMPTTDGINSWFISKYAREGGLKAVLSGVGADELYGGYPSFNRIKLINYLRRFPNIVLANAGLFTINNYKRVTYLSHKHPAADYLFLRGLFPFTDIARIVDIDERQLKDVLFGTAPLSQPGLYDGLHASWFETNFYMQNQLLRDTDVMSMSHGLEVRVPFLDEDFQEFTGQIDSKLKFDTVRPKQLLIDSFSNILPETVWNRPKMGFTFPLQEWMKNNTNIGNEELYQGKFAKTAIRKFKEGKLHWSKAYALYQIQKHG